MVATIWQPDSCVNTRRGSVTRHYERLPASHEAMILWAMIAPVTRRSLISEEDASAS
jgi:hypothetical protein